MKRLEGEGPLKMPVSLTPDSDGLPRVVTTRPGQDMALGEMAQRLGVCSALVDKLSPVPSTYGRQAAHTYL